MVPYVVNIVLHMVYPMRSLELAYMMHVERHRNGSNSGDTLFLLFAWLSVMLYLLYYHMKSIGFQDTNSSIFHWSDKYPYIYTF